MSERNVFGPSLKAERDRRGITLQAIADSTKISISLLAALERNDMSRWPSGIFRRAFVREYAAALGLPPEPLVAEFARLFPDGPSPETETPEVAELRLTFETEPSATWRMIRIRALVAVVEACSVMAVGSTLAWLMDGQAWSAMGVLALVYYTLAGVFLERTPTPRLIRPAGRARWLGTFSGSLTRRWPRPTRSPETEGTNGAAATAPEWAHRLKLDGLFR